MLDRARIEVIGDYWKHVDFSSKDMYPVAWSRTLGSHGSALYSTARETLMQSFQSKEASSHFRFGFWDPESGGSNIRFHTSRCAQQHHQCRRHLWSPEIIRLKVTALIEELL